MYKEDVVYTHMESEYSFIDHDPLLFKILLSST